MRDADTTVGDHRIQDAPCQTFSGIVWMEVTRMAPGIGEAAAAEVMHPDGLDDTLVSIHASRIEVAPGQT
jgi:hypothetical protein